MFWSRQMNRELASSRGRHREGNGQAGRELAAGCAQPRVLCRPGPISYPHTWLRLTISGRPARLIGSLSDETGVPNPIPSAQGGQ